MLIETQHLFIRNLRTEDGSYFIEMAKDGSLNDCGFDKSCSSWMAEWITEAKELAAIDNPCGNYLSYTLVLKKENIVIGSVGCSYYEDLRETGITYFIGEKYRNHGYAAEAVRAYTKYFLNHYNVQRLIATVRDENTASWKVVEKAGFLLTGKRMYKDINDEKEELYHFYEKHLDNSANCHKDWYDPEHDSLPSTELIQRHGVEKAVLLNFVQR